jgi:hypothetical protein
MTSINNADRRSGDMKFGVSLKRFINWTAVCLLVLAGISGCNYGAKHFIVENIGNIGGRSDEQRERLFSEAFPTRAEIEDFLHDTTILISWPPIGNTIRYFDNDQRFFSWHGTEISRGHWYLYPLIVNRILNGRSHFDWAYSYCIQLNDGSLNEDNCLLIHTTKQLLGSSRPTEYTKGDIFGLSKQRDPPFDMPTTEISIDQLRRQHR